MRSGNTLQHLSNESNNHQVYDDHPMSKTNTITKFTLQAESSRDFKKFLSSVAFAVPKGVVGRSVLETLRKIGLPVPTAAHKARDTIKRDKNSQEMFPAGSSQRRGTRTSAGDECVSDYSSEQGEESLFNDSEVLNYDIGFQSWLLTWRLPIYICCIGIRTPSAKQTLQPTNWTISVIQASWN